MITSFKTNLSNYDSNSRGCSDQELRYSNKLHTVKRYGRTPAAYKITTTVHN